jgi:hypothetical protein
VHPWRMLAATPPRCRLGGVAQRIAYAMFIETAGSVASCHAEMPAAVRGSRELVGPMSARNGNQVANHRAYRSRAHSAPNG